MTTGPSIGSLISPLSACMVERRLSEFCKNFWISCRQPCGLQAVGFCVRDLKIYRHLPARSLVTSCDQFLILEIKWSKSSEGILACPNLLLNFGRTGSDLYPKVLPPFPAWPPNISNLKHQFSETSIFDYWDNSKIGWQTRAPFKLLFAGRTALRKSVFARTASGRNQFFLGIRSMGSVPARSMDDRRLSVFAQASESW